MIVVFAVNFSLVLFEGICTILFFNVFMQRRTNQHTKANSVLALLIYAAVGLLNATFVHNLLVRGLFTVTLSLIIAIVLYQSSAFTKITLSVFMYFMLLGIDLIAVLIVTQVFTQDMAVLLNDGLVFFSLGALSKLVLFMLVMLVRRFWRFGAIQKAEKSTGWVVLFYPPAIASLAIFVIFRLAANSPQIEITSIRALTLFAAVGLLFLSMIIFYLAESITDRQRKIRENDLLRQKVEIETTNVLELAGNFETQRKMVHDFDNRLGAIQQLLAAGKYETASEFIARTAQNLERTAFYINTRNDMVDAVLNQKMALARRKGIRLEILAENLALLPIQPDDLVAILANVLDNAIEAAENVTDAAKIIQVKLNYKKEMWLFSVINPVQHPVLIRDNAVETTKEDKRLHGLGLRNVAASLERYGGTYMLFYNEEEKTFQFTAMVSFTEPAVLQPVLA